MKHFEYQLEHTRISGAIWCEQMLRNSKLSTEKSCFFLVVKGTQKLFLIKGLKYLHFYKYHKQHWVSLLGIFFPNNSNSSVGKMLAGLKWFNKIWQRWRASHLTGCHSKSKLGTIKKMLENHAFALRYYQQLLLLGLCFFTLLDFKNK